MPKTNQSQKAATAESLTQKYEDTHALLVSRLSVARKFGKKYNEEVKKWYKDYDLTSFSGLDKSDDLHNLLQVPYIFSSIESTLPALFESAPALIMNVAGEKDREFTDWVNLVWSYIKRKLRLDEKVETHGFDFLTIGMMSAKWGWERIIEVVEEPTDNPVLNDDGSPVIDPQTQQPAVVTTYEKIPVPIKDLPFVKFYRHNRIFFSPESEFTTDDEENLIPHLFFMEILSPDEVLEEYKVKIEGDSQLNLSEYFEEDEDAEEEKKLLKKDLKRSHVFEYYGTLPKKESHDKKWRSDKVYQMAITQKEVLTEPVPVAKKPSTLAGNYGGTDSFWRFGEPKVMRELEQDISFGRSTMADYRDKMATKVVVPQGCEFDEELLKDPKKYAILRMIGDKYPDYLKPPPIPDAVISSIEMSRQDIQMASAMMDISRGSMAGTVDSATGQKIFDEASDKRNERKRRKIALFIRALAKNLLPLCAENWDAEKFAEITDEDNPQIIEGFIEKLKKVGEEIDVEIDIEDATTNPQQKAANAIAFYRETINDQYANHQEILKEVVRVGFGKKDPERYIVSDMITAQDILKVIPFLMEHQAIDPQIAQVLLEQAQVEMAGLTPGGGPGRPSTQDPTQVVKKTMKTDGNQMNAQRNAAYKQTNVAKGPQGV